METAQRLLSPRFLLMCGFSFTVFLSAFQLLPVAPYRILALGGTAAVAGLFLGFLTYSSAATAPLTGALVDRVGPRRILVISSLAITAFSLLYAVLPTYPLMLSLVVVHGAFWSGLLSASGAYVTSLVPPARRAEGIGYWGLSTVLAVAVAPSIGLWVYGHGGWTMMCVESAALNVLMAAIAWRLPPDPPRRPNAHAVSFKTLIEWRVLVVSFSLFLYAFGYGGLTSFIALYTDANGVTPRALYFTLFSLTILVTRPFVGRFADRIGYRRVFLPCVALTALAFGVLALGGTRPHLIASAILFGAGFGSAYPVFLAYVLQFVDENRRGAAFGSIIGMFDTGIGTGSIVLGPIIEQAGYQAAWATAAALAALSIPFFLFVEPRVLRP
ncbi:MAG: MFS transporter [Acidobacteria bacterium]|nr:MFS transporter [Acidobacteriota bacterium]